MTTIQMRCSNCRTNLSPEKVRKLIHWVCDNCHGRAVNLAVMRRRHVEFAQDLWRLALSTSQRGKPCPSCERPMVQVDAQGTEGLLVLDVCKMCQMVWLDSDELRQVPEAPPDTSQTPELPQEAAAALAKFAVAESHAMHDRDLLWDRLLHSLHHFFHL